MIGPNAAVFAIRHITPAFCFFFLSKGFLFTIACLGVTMAMEVERKFLVADVAALNLPAIEGTRIRQAYLADQGAFTLRVRLAGTQAFITFKESKAGLSRHEFEYPIEPADAQWMIEQWSITAAIDKVRYPIRHAGNLWEVDVFGGANDGLVVAEIELENADREFAPPEWLGREITGEARFYNQHLAHQPYSQWPADLRR